MTKARAHKGVLLILREFAATHGRGGEFDNLFDGVRPEDIDSLLDHIQIAREVSPGPCLQGIEDALKISAEADVIQAYIACERYLDEQTLGDVRDNHVERCKGRMLKLHQDLLFHEK